jgi:hypothetical protein
MTDFNEFMNTLWNAEGQYICGTVDGQNFCGTITDVRYMYGNDIAVTIDDDVVCDHQYVLHGSNLFEGDVELSDSGGVFG